MTPEAEKWKNGSNNTVSQQISHRGSRGGQESATKLNNSTTTKKNFPIAVSRKNITSAKEKRQIMRNNVLQVLLKSNVMPFHWLKSSYRCFYCYDIFQEATELKAHQVNHPDDEAKIKAMNNFWDNVVYVDISNLSCKLCTDPISDLYGLIDHLVEKHSVEYNKVAGVTMTGFKLDNYNIACEVCGANFHTFGQLLQHTNKDHKEVSPVLCDVCGQHFKDQYLLRLHVKSLHDNAGVLCNDCGQKFESRYKLKTHQKNLHNLQIKYKCLACPLTFENHYKRSLHMFAEHKNIREEIKCLHCPKTFIARSKMMAHLRYAHLKERNFACGVCGFKASNNYRLKNHMYKHSGEKNFKCYGCDKAFSTKKTMRAHFARMHKTTQQTTFTAEMAFGTQTANLSQQ